MTRAGLRFGRYESLFRIAAGGMAEVFAARLEGEAGFEKRVAVKRILPLLAEDESFVSMFLEEARIGVQLDSPYIAQTLDVGRCEDGAPYLVQELVIGVDLVELLGCAVRADVLVPLDVAVGILAQAGEGLHHAHEAKALDGRSLELVHRDVSPHNLIVGQDGRVRLTDFGVARVAFDRLVATRTGTVKGKLAYLAPEQIAGSGIDRRTDVFALGVVAWELLTGARLFYRRTPTETLEEVQRGVIPDVRELREVPQEIAEAVAAALHRDPASRTPTALAFVDALRRGAHRAGIEPSAERVAAFVEHIDPPRLKELRARLARLSEDPRTETLGDIDLPEVDSYELTLEREEETTVDRARDRETRAAGRLVGISDQETVLLGDRSRPPDTEIDRPRPSTLAAVVMIAVGVLLGLAAVWLLSRA